MVRMCRLNPNENGPSKRNSIIAEVENTATKNVYKNYH